MISPLLVAAVFAISGAYADGPDLYVPIGTSLVEVTAEGHPVEVRVESIAPSGAIMVLNVCQDTPVCSGPVDINEFGLWRFLGTVEYAHKDPDGSPYVNVVATSATADPQPIFSDGFENGTTAAWSRTQGGTS